MGVVVPGISTGTGCTASAELYNPPPQMERRGHHAGDACLRRAILLQDGMVLLVGGAAARNDHAALPPGYGQVVASGQRERSRITPAAVLLPDGVPLAAVRNQRHPSLLAIEAVLQIPRHWGVAAR